MGIDRKDATGAILAALENLNEELDEDQRFEIQEDMRLFGSDSALDSVGLVSVIMDVEALMEERHGLEIDLTDERAMSLKRSPFRTVDTLADYVCTLAAEQDA